MNVRNHPLYPTWAGMKQRCYIKTAANYKYYGGRGIKICSRWRKSFYKFVEDVGDKPKGATLERIDNDGDYTPENCRWAGYSDQLSNRGLFKNNSSGHVAVYAQAGKWVVRYRVKGKMTHIGIFSTREEAIEVYHKNKQCNHCANVNDVVG